MKWLIEHLVAMFGAMRGRSARREAEWQERLYGSTAAREEEVSTVRSLGGGRTRSVSVIGPRASSDGVSYESETLDYWTQDDVQTKVNYHETRRCDCGALLRQDNAALGTCSVCSRVLCHAEGCAARCERCGALTCAGHSFKLRKHIFCRRHLAYALWLFFWGMLK